MKSKLTFETMEQFQQYVCENKLDFANLEIFECKEDEVVEVKESIEEIKAPADIFVNISSLYDSPKIKAKVGSANIIYADKIHINENVCMPTKIDLLGRSIWINACNENGVTHGSFNIAINEQTLYNVLFEIKEKGDNIDLLEIKQDIIERKNEL